MKPGIYRNLSWEQYRAIDAWNPSSVLPGRISMLEVDYQRRHPKQTTTGMRFGSAVHCAVLEPDLFPLQYCMWDGIRRGNKYDEFVDANVGREVLTLEEYDRCLAARDSARRHPVAGPLLSMGDPEDAEVSLVWNDYHTGLLCKSRADLLLPMIIELKTTTGKVADNRGLTRIASNFGYHTALAAKQDGVNTLTGETASAKIIFVEQKAPHDTRVMNISDAVMAQGYDEWQRLLEQIKGCVETGIWPGCDSGESDLVVWADEIEPVNITLDGVII